MLASGDMTSSNRELVVILGGVEAVQALNGDEEDDYDDGDDDDDDLNEKEAKPKKRVTHKYNPMHADGLHDFVGIGYVVDEVIRTRFSIFPSHPVSIGSTWKRTLMLSDGLDPTVRGEVTEEYKLVAVTRADINGPDFIEKGDMLAEIEVNAREKPAEVKLENNAHRISPDPNEDIDQEKISPQFFRPSFAGHDFTTTGKLFVHIKTGFVISGEAKSEATSERTLVVINKKTQTRKTIKAKADITATTDYRGSIFA